MKCLELKEQKFINCLNLVRERVTLYWQQAIHNWYTDHRISHSERIISCLKQLLEIQPDALNEAERFVLLAAIYLHDIGMQLPEYAGLEKKSEYGPDELEIIRKKHNEAGAAAIMDSIVRPDLDFGLATCKDYVKFIADVARAHRKVDLNELESVRLGGEKINIPLLGALIRLGDELDADFRRVNIDILATIDIPPESKFHWWCHHYVQSVFIENGIIYLDFRFPEKYKDDDKVKLIKDRISTSIRDQLNEVYEILYNNGIKFYSKIKEKITFQPVSLRLIPPDLDEILNTQLATKKLAGYLSIVNSVTSISSPESPVLPITVPGTIWFVEGISYIQNSELIKLFNNIFAYMKEENYKKAIEEIEEYGDVISVNPLDEMNFYLIAGNCYYNNADMKKAGEYYNKLLNISSSKSCQEIYKDLAKSFNALARGGTALVYQQKGEFSKAKECYEKTLEIQKQLLDNDKENIVYRQYVAGTLNDLGTVCSNMGRLKQAMEIYEEALDNYKVLLKMDKENKFYQSDMGIILNNQSEVFLNMGQLEKAMGSLQEALQIRRSLLESDNKNKLYQVYVSGTLNNLGNVFVSMGQLEKAIECFEEALQMRKALLESDKENKFYQTYVVMTSNNLGNVFLNMGQLEKAKKIFEVALEIQNTLLKFDNKNKLLQRYVAGILNNLGNVFKDMGQWEKAIEFLTEALNISNTLLETDRENLIYQSDVSRTLNSLGDVYRNMGQLKRAKDYFEETLKIRTVLLESDQENLIYKNNVAVTLNNLGGVFMSLGYLEKAREKFEEALGIRRFLVKSNKESRIYNRELSTLLSNLGVVLMNMDHLEKAKVKFEEALCMKEKLLEYDKGNKSYQYDLAMILNNLGEVLRNMGDLEKAREKFEATLHIYEKVLESDKENTSYQSDLAMALNNLGNVLGGIGKLEEAKEILERALDKYRLLLKTDQKNTFYRCDTAMALNNLGDVIKDMGELEKAINIYKEALEHYKFLLQIDKDNKHYQIYMAMTLNNIGIVFKNMVEPEKAMEMYEKALKLYKSLLEFDKDNSIYQKYMAMSLNNQGNLLKNTDRLEDAMEKYREALELYQKTGYLSGKALSLNNIGTIYLKKRELDNALQYFQDALAIFRQIGDRVNEAQQLYNISFIYKEKGDLKNAYEYEMKAAEIHRELAEKKKEAEKAEIKTQKPQKIIESFKKSFAEKAIKINSITIEGFRSLKNIVWTPANLNIIIGPNGAGKSNLLRALKLIKKSFQGKLAKYVQSSGGMGAIVWDGEAEKIKFDITFTPLQENNDVKNNVLNYYMELERLGKGSSFRIDKENLIACLINGDGKEEKIELLKREGMKGKLYSTEENDSEDFSEEIKEEETIIGTSTEKRLMGELKKQIQSWEIYHDIDVGLEAKIRQPAVARHEEKLDSDGQNLINVLHTFYTNNRSFKEDINDAMFAAFGDDFEELIFSPDADGKIQLKISWKSLSKPRPAADLSDGTIRFLFLLTVLVSPVLPSLIAIDEPSAGLHPSMLPVIAEFAQDASERGSQIIMTTHSAEFLDAFRDIHPAVTVARWDRGESILKVIEKKELEYWLKEYTLGSLFRSGELEDM